MLEAGQTKTILRAADLKAKADSSSGFLHAAMGIASTVYAGMYFKLVGARGFRYELEQSFLTAYTLGYTLASPGQLCITKYNTGVSNYENVVVIHPSLYLPFKGDFEVRIKEYSGVLPTIIRYLGISFLMVYEE